MRLVTEEKSQLPVWLTYTSEQRQNIFELAAV
jgi:hypothetical protein